MKIEAPTSSIWVNDCSCHNIGVIRIYAVNGNGFTVQIKIIVVWICRIDTGSYLDYIAIFCRVNSILSSSEWVFVAARSRTIRPLTSTYIIPAALATDAMKVPDTTITSTIDLCTPLLSQILKVLISYWTFSFQAKEGFRQLPIPSHQLET